MASQVVQLKHIGNVTFSQNRRSKNIKLSVKADKSVRVSFPLYVSGKEALAFVEKNKDWICKQQDKMSARQTQIKPGTEIHTKLYKICFVKGEPEQTTRSSNTITITLKNFSSEESLALIDAQLTEIYRFEAKQLLPVRLAELAERHNFSYNKVTIRNNRRNWGSCSSQNNISLNLQMMKLPVHLIDYILLHELVHTKIKNHGPDFWKLLNEITKEKARQLAGEMKKYSTYTI